MIVRDEGEELVLVTQPDHAHFAAETLKLFRTPELVAHPRRRALLRAVRLHDNGWREADAAPRVDDGGRPLAFRDVGPGLRAEIWRRGILRYGDEDPYVALLTLAHARALHPDPDDALRALLDEVAEAVPEWLERAAVASEDVDSDYPWLALADLLSLCAAQRPEEPVAAHGHQVRWSGDGLVVEPFPLAGATRFSLAARRIPARRYRSDGDLAVALAGARWIRLEVRLRPAS